MSDDWIFQYLTEVRTKYEPDKIYVNNIIDGENVKHKTYYKNKPNKGESVIIDDFHFNRGFYLFRGYKPILKQLNVRMDEKFLIWLEQNFLIKKSHCYVKF
jgi:hypothetical protein